MKIQESEQFFGGQNCDKRETTIPSGETTSSDSINQSEESQTSAHNKNTMAKETIFADASQGGAEAQLATGHSVENDQSDKSSVRGIFSRIADKDAIETRHLISYCKAKEIGVKLAFFDYNRKVNHRHVQKLIKSLTDSKTFTKPINVVCLRDILEKFPGITATNLDGDKVTLETPDIDNYYAVVDGQHRTVACEYSGDIDVMLEITDFDGIDPLQRIKEMNTNQICWKGEDYRNSNMIACKGDTMFYKESIELQDQFDITSTTSLTILMFKKNPIRIKDIVEGKETTEYVEENVNRGKYIFIAAMMSSGGAKEFKRREFIECLIDTFNDEPDSKKHLFARKMKVYMATMPKTDINSIKELISNKNFGELKRALKDGYRSFCSKNANEDDLAEMEKTVNTNINTYLANLKSNVKINTPSTLIQSGRVHEILNNKKVEEQIKKDKEAKKQEKANKVKESSDKPSVADNVSVAPAEEFENKEK